MSGGVRVSGTSIINVCNVSEETSMVRSLCFVPFSDKGNKLTPNISVGRLTLKISKTTVHKNKVMQQRLRTMKLQIGS